MDDRDGEMEQKWVQARVDELVALGLYVEVDIMGRFHIMCNDQKHLDDLTAWMNMYNYEFHPYDDQPAESLHRWSDLIEFDSQLYGFVLAMREPNVEM